MNYFGHACVANWSTDSPAVVLGAMLPDFAAMVRARIASLQSGRLREGAALHQRTDAAFHRLAEFRRLYRDGARALEERGLGRGPARGAAHVGVELLLDGELLDQPGAQTAYLDALRAASRPELARAIHWRSPDAARRWVNLLDRLREAGAPLGYRTPGRVAEGIERALHGRRHLQLDDEAPGRVAGWVGDAQPRVRAAVPRILAALRAEVT
ncbi:MAG: hypothetical protein J4G09_06495 [Proteobacteria bacterium]|nr:hypothetical protein [Pseudomonadota bacterium]